MTQSLESDGYRKNGHEFLLDILVGCLFSHSLHHTAILEGTFMNKAVIAQQPDNLIKRHLSAGIRLKVCKEI